MALSSASTREVVKAQIADNLAYDVEDSVAKCRLLIEALRHWLVFYAPLRVQHGGASRGSGEELEQDTTRFERLLRAAESWLAVNDASASPASGAGVRFYESSGFRD